MKTCTKCKIEKDVSEFNKKKASKDGLAPECKSCKAKVDAKYYAKNHESAAKYRAENKERKDAYNAKYREEHREELAEYYAKWRSKNSEYIAKYAAENKEHRAEYNAKWRKDNTGKVNAYCAKRRAKLLNNITPTTCLKTIELIYAQCPEGYHVDHIVPLAKKGKHHQDNLCYLPASLNASKGAKILEDYPELLKQFNEQVIYPNIKA